MIRRFGTVGVDTPREGDALVVAVYGNASGVETAGQLFHEQASTGQLLRLPTCADAGIIPIGVDAALETVGIVVTGNIQNRNQSPLHRLKVRASLRALEELQELVGKA